MRSSAGTVVRQFASIARFRKSSPGDLSKWLVADLDENEPFLPDSRRRF
jgi:hypothetical protein